MTFHKKKNAKFYPGFVCPTDVNSIRRAKKITANGYPSNSDDSFFEFAENIPEILKKQPEKLALNEFNKIFGLSYK